MAPALLIDLLLIAAVVFAGFLIGVLLLPGEPLLTRCAVSFPIGAGLAAFVVFLLGWIGLTVNLATYGAAFLLVVATAFGLRFLLRQAEGVHAAEQSTWALSGSEQAGVLIAAALALLALGWLAVARSYSTWDAMAIWSVKGYGVVRDGSIFAAKEWGSHGLTYPLQLPILIGGFALAEGDILPGSKLLFPLYYLSLLLGVYAFNRRRAIRWPWAAVATLTVASVPLVFEHAVIGYANLPLTALLVLGLLMFIWDRDRITSGRALLSGVLLGLAAWMRPEAVYLVAAGMLAWAAVAVRSRRESVAWAAWWLPVILIGGSWMVFNFTYGVTGVFGDAVQTAWASLRALDLNPSGAYRVLRFLAGRYASPEVWGLAAPLTAVLALSAWRRLAPDEDPQAFSLFTAALAWAVPVLVFYYLLSFRGDLEYWLGTGIDRLMMPGTVAALLWGLTVGLPNPDSERQKGPSPSQ